MEEISRRFNSKLLLFGEYSLMYGSMALSVPYNLFTGQLLIDNDTDEQEKYLSRKYILEYLEFLKSLGFSKQLDLNKIEADVDRGLQFQCDIPISYGLGSSGAVVASFYDAYAFEKTDDINNLKKIFSKMESYYHGNSSGLDPLVSYVNKPILISKSGNLTTLVLKHRFHEESGLFLLDTKTTGETQPLVQWFVNEYQKPEYQNVINNEIIPANRRCIENFIIRNNYSLNDNMALLSQLTYNHFKPMIPETVIQKWEQGLASGIYSLKLCGSGGGGMMLGYSYNLQKADEMLGGILPVGY